MLTILSATAVVPRGTLTKIDAGRGFIVHFGGFGSITVSDAVTLNWLLGPWIVIVPVSLGDVIAAGFIDTESVAGVTPSTCETDNQFWPDSVVTETLKGVGPPLLVTASVPGAGGLFRESVREATVSLSTNISGWALTLRTTGITVGCGFSAWGITRISALYVPGVSPDGFTVTVIFAVSAHPTAPIES
jgi:hypothetical protein